MCDCFHLAFPNWHAPAAGAGRRLRGPEQDTEDDLVCEEPELLETERPRPQGSSPVDEFPADKKAQEIYDLQHKSEGIKKVKKVSCLDKFPSTKMNETEDIQPGKSGVIVKTVKEASVDGLVVTGGGKEGIFIKEVKPDSPASKLSSVKEGDQILSATIYFDDVSYEDALQIFEHAQPYKLEFCLRRKVDSITPEYAEIKYPESKEGASPKTRRQKKIKKQQDRISWPKFPSFGKGPKAQFKRSHSTSEAEEHRKLEISPPTSDTESPFKSPLKSPDEKDKKKKHKVQIKMKMKGYRSKSVEEAQRNGKDLTSEHFVVLENQGEDILEENGPDDFNKKSEDILQVLEEDSSKIGNEKELRHTVHLISLGNTLKTTDIQMNSSDGGKTECSEVKLRIQGETSGTETDSPSKPISPVSRNLEPSPCDNVTIFQEMIKQSLLDTDINTEEVHEHLESRKVETIVPNLNIFSEVGEVRISPRTDSENPWKEKTVLENESYGIRTRGPMASMATSKTHFVNTLNGLQFMSPHFPNTAQEDVSEVINDTKKQPKHDAGNIVCTVAIDDSNMGITSKQQPKTITDNIQTDSHMKSESNIKLPKVNLSEFVISEPITIKEVKTKTQLPKREDIRIPGMEDKKTKPRTHEMKIPKMEKVINITKEKSIQSNEEFNVEDVKTAVSKFPAFKLPEGDITGVLVQREITIMEMKAERSSLTPKSSPNKIPVTSTESSSTMQEIVSTLNTVDQDTANKIPKVDLPYIDENTSLLVIRKDYTKSEYEGQKANSDKILITNDDHFRALKFKLPNREDIEIPGMEAIKELNIPTTELKATKEKELYSELPQCMRNSLVFEQETPKIMVQAEKSKKPKTKKYGDQKGQEKKSKRAKTSTSSAGIMNLDMPYSDSSELSKTYITSQRNLVDSQQKEQPAKFKIPTIGENYEDDKIDIEMQELRILEDQTSHNLHLTKESVEEANANANVSKETELEGQGKKFKLPKFEFNFPELKAPKITLSSSKKEGDSSVPEEKNEIPVVHPPHAELFDAKSKLKDEMPGADSKHIEVKLKRSDVPLLEGSVELEEANNTMLLEGSGQKDKKKFGSPTKFKIPSITLPKFGSKVPKEAMKSSDAVKGPELILPDAELKSSAEVNIELPSVEKESKSQYLEMTDPDIQSKGTDRTFKLPKFEISFPDVKGPKTDLSSKTVDSDWSITKGKVQVHSPGHSPAITSKVKIEQQEDTGKGFEVKQKKTELPFSKAGFSKSETKTPVDVNLQNTVLSLQEEHIGMEKQSKEIDFSKEESGHKHSTKFSSPTKITLPSITLPKFGIKQAKVEISSQVESRTLCTDVKQPEINVSSEEIKLTNVNVSLPKGNVKTEKPKDSTKFGSPTKFKLPTISFPKFGAKQTKPEILVVDKDVKAPEMALPGEELKLVSEPLSVDMKEPDVSKELKSLNVEMKDEDITIEGKESKFKFPKFGITLPEVKGPHIDLNLKTAEIDTSVPKAKLQADTPDVDMQNATAEVKEDQLENESKSWEVKIKRPEFSFPRFGFSRSENKPQEVDLPNVNVSLPEGSAEIADENIKTEDKEGKFQLPKFGISLPEMKGTKMDLKSKGAKDENFDQMGALQAHLSAAEVQDVRVEMKVDLPEHDSKGFDVKIKKPGFSFPRIGFSESEPKTSESEVKLTNVNISLSEGNVETEESKDSTKFGSPTKFNLPTISFPKFGAKQTKPEILVVDKDVKAPEMALPGEELKLVSEPLSVDMKEPDVNKELKSLNLEMKDEDITIEGKESKFKFPKFGITLPEVKGPHIDLSLKKAEIDTSVPKAKLQADTPDVDVQNATAEVKEDQPENESKIWEVKIKRPEFSFPRFGFGRSENKPKEVELPNVNVSLPEGSVEMDGLNTDITLSGEDSELKESESTGSSTKFKLPSFSFPKISIKGSKATVGLPDVNADVQDPEINLPDAEFKLSDKTVSVDAKGPDVDKEIKPLSLEMADQNIKTEDKEAKFQLPKFGISLPEMKGTKMDLKSKGTKDENFDQMGALQAHLSAAEVQDVRVEMKVDFPEHDSKGLDVKIKKPGFSFPRIGFSESEPKTSESEVKLTNVNISLSEENVETEESKDSTKFGSPTKFNLPTISFPKFGAKQTKPEILVVDKDVKAPEMALPGEELKLVSEPLSVDMKEPDVSKELKSLNVEMKDEDITIEGKESKFKFPKFGITLPEVKGPHIDLSLKKAEIDTSVPKAKLQADTPDVDVQDATAEVKEDQLENESKSWEVKIKRPEFSFPRFGFSRSENKPQEVDLPNVNVSLPEGSAEIADENIKTEDKEGKFQLPKFGISLPEMKGTKMDLKSKGAKDENFDQMGALQAHLSAAEVQDVRVEMKVDLPEHDSKGLDVKIKKPGFSFPRTGFSKDTKTPENDVNLCIADVSLSERSAEIEELKDSTKFGSPTKFKLPTISLPKFGIKQTKREIPAMDRDDKVPKVSVLGSELKFSAEPQSINIKGPDEDKEVKSLHVEIKDSKFKLPTFGISLPEMKGPKIDLSSKREITDFSASSGEPEALTLNADVQDVTAKTKVDLPENASKGLEVKIKKPETSFPKIGFGKSDTKAQEAEVNLPTVEESLPTGSAETSGPKYSTKFGSPTKFKLPTISFPKFAAKLSKETVDISAVDTDDNRPEMNLTGAELTLSSDLPEAELNFPNVDTSLPEGTVDFERLTTDITLATPSVSLPKMEAEVLRATSEFSEINENVKKHDITLLGTELNLSDKLFSVDRKVSDEGKDMKTLSAEIKDQNIKIKGKDSSIKLPTFQISLPEMKGIKSDLSSQTTELNKSIPKGIKELHEDVSALPESDSKDLEFQIKLPGISFPRLGFSKSETMDSEVNVNIPNEDMSFPEGSVQMQGPDIDLTLSKEDSKQKESRKFGSPTKFKLPSISLPKFGTKVPKATAAISSKDTDAKGPDAEMSDEPLSVDVTGSNIDKEIKSVSVEMTEQDIRIEDQESKFKFPKFDISVPEFKGSKIKLGSKKAKIDVSEEREGLEAPISDVQELDVRANVNADLPETDFKGHDVKIKKPGFSFPRLGFTKSETMPPSAEVNLSNVNVSLPEVSVKVEEPKVSTKFGSPTKFKLPTISLPKFGAKQAKVEMSTVGIDVQGPNMTPPDAALKLVSKPLTANIRGPDIDKEVKSLTLEIQDQDNQIEGQDSKFKLPSSEISLPQVETLDMDLSSKEVEIDISVPKGKLLAHMSDIDAQGLTAEVKVELQENASKEFEGKMKPEFSFPMSELSKSETKTPETAVNLPNVDLSLPDRTVKIDGPNTDNKISVEDFGQKEPTMFLYPAKFKLPTITLTEMEAKETKAAAVDVVVEEPEMTLPGAELNLSAEPQLIDKKVLIEDKKVKSLSLEMKDQDVKTEGKDNTFKLPSFGISFPTMKGTKIDLSSQKAEPDILLPKGKEEMHVPGIEVRTDLPEKDSKDLEVIIKKPGISFPRFGFSKSEIKPSKGDASHPNVDASVPVEIVEMEGPDPDMITSKEDSKQKESTKFGSPTKFKLPSLSLPKFGTKVPKPTIGISNVNEDDKKPEVDLADSELKLSGEPLSAGIAVPNVQIYKDVKQENVELNAQNIQTKGQESRFKLPKFEISLSEFKGPKIELGSNKAEKDIAVPKEKVALPPGVEEQNVTAEVKPDAPDMDSKTLEVKNKKSGFLIPKFGFSAAETDATDFEAKAPKVDVPLREESVQLEEINKGIDSTIKDADQKETTEDVKKASAKFGSPTKFKLPSIKFPKFGAKATKETVDLPSEEDPKITKITLPDSEVKLSSEPLTINIKETDEDKAEKSLIPPDQTLVINLPNVDLQQAVGDCKQNETEVDKHSSVFKIPTFETASQQIKTIKVNIISKEMDTKIAKSQDDQNIVSTTINVTSQPQHKEQIHPPKYSPKRILPTINEVLKSFDVEFNVPKLPTNDEDIFVNNKNKDDEKSSIKEVEEDSPTLSLRSSEAFADVSSGPTTEQIGPSETSPTKVKVKYSESAGTSEFSDIHSDVITSTAKTELISIKPHQPEKVNIPFSSETSSSSVHTLKKAPEEIHIFGHTEQMVSITQYAAGITDELTHDIQTLPSEQVTDSVVSVEKIIVRKEHTLMEKHVMKEIFGDDKDSVFVTQKMHVLEGGLSEPVVDSTATSIQKLKDTVHSEKMRFFQSVESTKKTVTSTETFLRHADSSADENEGK